MRSYLIALRRSKGLTQTEASKALGCSLSLYRMVEEGKSWPKTKAEFAGSIATCYGVAYTVIAKAEAQYMATHGARYQ